MWRLLPAAVLVEVAFDVFGFVHAIQNEITPNISSTVVRFLLMGTLGGLALFKGVRWARRLLAGLLYFAGVVFLFASFAALPVIGPQTGRLHFEPVLLMFALANLLVAVAATVGGRATEARFQAARSTRGCGNDPLTSSPGHEA